MLEAQILVMCAGVRILLQNIGRQGACRFVLFRGGYWFSISRKCSQGLRTRSYAQGYHVHLSGWAS